MGIAGSRETGAAGVEAEPARLLGGRDWLVAAVLSLAITVPFLDKPIHIDDPVVLRVAENILRDASDPLAGRMDWFGHELPLWEVTTNPPLLSYWLAPALALFGPSERALHAFMIPFLLALAVGMRLLSARFAGGGWMPTVFVMASPAFVVSVNLMRDVPAAALLCLGVALFVAGIDRADRGLLVAGALACGLAAVTKYSAAAAFPLLAGYGLWRRPRLAAWSLVAAAPLALWCLHTQIRHGWIHPLYLASGTHPNRTSDPADQFFAAVAIIGASLFLAPALAAGGGRRRTRLESFAAAAIVLGAAWLYRGGLQGGQAALWLAAGSILLWIVFREGLRRSAGEGWFLALWAAAFLLFSVTLAPFQAVRHLLPALPPVTLLAFRAIHPKGIAESRRGWTVVLGLLLALQLATACAVNLADVEYASSYRGFASRFKLRGEAGVWFVGHWGWMHYARQAGFRQLHREGPAPAAGDILLWPERVHVGDAMAGREELRERLELIDSIVYEGRIPLRTMNFRCAAFYATIRGNLPYCFQNLPLERFKVFRVR